MTKFTLLGNILFFSAKQRCQGKLLRGLAALKGFVALPKKNKTVGPLKDDDEIRKLGISCFNCQELCFFHGRNGRNLKDVFF